MNIHGSSINQKLNNARLVMLCTEATFAKKKFCLVARIVSFDTVVINLYNFCILEPYPSKDILTLIVLL